MKGKGKGKKEEEEKGKEGKKGNGINGGIRRGNGIDSNIESTSAGQGCSFIDSPMWLSTKDAAIYLRKFRKIDGVASDGAIRTAIWRRAIRAKKWRGRLYIKRADLDLMLQNSPFASGGY